MSESRLKEKADVQYDGSAAGVIDLSRGAFVMRTADQLETALEALAADGEHEMVYAVDRMTRPSRLGFADAKVYLRNSRQFISAMRLIVQPMLEAQALALADSLHRGAIRAALTADGPFTVVVVDLFNFDEADGLFCIDGFPSFDEAYRYAASRQQDSVDLLREPGQDTATHYTSWLCLGEALAVVTVGDVTAAHVLVSDKIHDMLLDGSRSKSTDWAAVGEAVGARAKRLCDLIPAKSLTAILERHRTWCTAQRRPLSADEIEATRGPGVGMSSTEGPIRGWHAESRTWNARVIRGSALTYPLPAKSVDDALNRRPPESERDRADLRKTSFFNVWDPESGAAIDELNFEAALLDEAELDGYSIRDSNFEHASLVRAHLSRMLIRSTSFRFADLREAKLNRSQVRRADFQHAWLQGADLQDGEFIHGYFTGAKMAGANLRNTHLVDADFTDADLSGANLSGADLRWCRMVRTNLNGATLDGARVFGLSAWSVQTDQKTSQRDLAISEDGSGITVNRLDIAQLLHLALDNRNLTHVINAFSSKLVLILGRFTAPRMDVLRFVATVVERHGLIPVIFDFSLPDDRDVTETVRALAHLSALVVADLTDPRSVPQELSNIVPTLPSLPVIPIIEATQAPYSMFPHFQRYPWVQTPVAYSDQSTLEAELGSRLVAARGAPRATS